MSHKRFLEAGGRPQAGQAGILTTMIYEHMDKDAIFENFADYTPF